MIRLSERSVRHRCEFSSDLLKETWEEKPMVLTGVEAKTVFARDYETGFCNE